MVFVGSVLESIRTGSIFAGFIVISRHDTFSLTAEGIMS